MFRKTIFLTAALMCAGTLFAQDDIKQKGVTELRNEMTTLINDKKFIEARPYADELVKRLADAKDDASKALVSRLYYFKGYSFFQEYANSQDAKKLNEAIKYLDKVLENPDAEEVKSSIDLKSTCYIHLKKYKQAAEALAKLLEEPFVSKISTKEQLNIVRRIAQSLYSMREWSGSDKWFIRLLNTSPIAEDKIMAASGLMQTYIASKDYEKAKKYLPYMVIDEPARYDVSLNIAFLSAAADLSSDKVRDFATAAIFYSMTYDKDKLISFFEGYKKNLESEIEKLKLLNPDNPRILDMEGKIAVAENQLKMLSGIDSYTAPLMFGKARNYLATERDYESFWAYKQLIDNFPEDPQIETYYYSAFLGAYRIGKSDEMFKLGQTYLEKFPTGQFIKDVTLQIAIYYNEKGMKEEFFATAFEFIPKYYKDNSSSSMIYLMGKSWIEDGKFDELKSKFKEYLKSYADGAISDSLLYWSGLAGLATGDFKPAYENFQKLTDKYSTSPYAEDGFFRMGIASYGMQDLNKAQEIFTKFIDTYMDSELCGEAEFFLGDINLGSGYIKEAMQHYALVEKKTTSQSYIDNAYFQRISILSKSDDVIDIIKLIDQYEKKYPNGNIAMMEFERSNALSKSSKQAQALISMKNLIERYGNDKTLDGVDKALQKYVEDYETTKVTLNKSIEFLQELLKNEKLLTDMVKVPAERYRYFQKNSKIDNAIYLKLKSDEKYSVNLLTDKKPLEQLLADYNKQMSMFPKQTPAEFYTSLLNASKDKKQTLYFRMMMALDKYCSAPIPQRSFNEDDYKLASPSTLIWIAKHSEKYGLEGAKKTYQYVLDSDSDPQYMFDAILGMAAIAEKQGDFEGALKLYIQAQDDYPSDTRVWQVAVKHGETLVKLGRIAEAKKKFEDIRKTPDWRGEAYAAALYNQAILEEKGSNFDAALNYYDNCAIGYSNCIKYSGKAAIAEAKLYVKMGDMQKAKETCEAYLKTPDAKSSPQYDEIQNFLRNL